MGYIGLFFPGYHTVDSVHSMMASHICLIYHASQNYKHIALSFAASGHTSVMEWPHFLFDDITLVNAVPWAFMVRLFIYVISPRSMGLHVPKWPHQPLNTTVAKRLWPVCGLVDSAGLICGCAFF